MTAPSGTDAGRTALSRGRAGRTVPFAPLEELIAGGRPRHAVRSYCTWCDGADRCCITVEMIAEALGVRVEQTRRWRGKGLSLRHADVLAVAVGLVPEIVWGPDWDA